MDGSHSCTYDFTIEETNADDHGLHPIPCHFAVQTEDNETAARISFSNIPCGQSTQYLYGGSWGSNGYFVLTVNNVEGNLRAYFGYSDDEITSGQTSSPHHSLGYMINNVAVSGQAARISVKAADPVRTDENAQEIPQVPSSDIFIDIPTVDGDVDASSGSTVDKITRDTLQGEKRDGQGIYNAIWRFFEKSDGHPPTELSEPVIASDGDQSDHTAELLANAVEACPIGPAEVAPDKKADTFGTVKLPDDDTSPGVPPVAITWSMKNITRSKFCLREKMSRPESDTRTNQAEGVQYNPNSVHADFLIDILPSGPVDVPCTIQVNVDTSENPAFASWYVEPCQRSGWYLSWGYNAGDDSAVATLIR